MQRITSKPNRKRQGAVVVLVATMMVVLVGVAAFAVDYGYLLKLRTDMQRSADASVLAAVQTLVPESTTGVQDLNAARATLREYVQANLDGAGGATFNVADEDIEIGRYDPDTIYSNVTLLNSGIFDAIRVTLRRDGAINARAPLFFGRAFGIDDTTITVVATAVLQKPNTLGPGNSVLPYAVHEDLWEDLDIGDSFTGYGDGKVQDEDGNEIPGNWGTVDIGSTNNSTSDLGDQIVNGLRQDDLDALFADGRISQDTHIDGDVPVWLQADPGLSSGQKSYVRQIHGQERIIPIYESLAAAGGNNLEFRVAGWGVVTVVDSRWNGSKNTWVELQKSYMYSGDLSAKPNSLDDEPAIEGAYGAPVLVE